MTDPAYRTISEVATLIGVPHHVLRFWETKFPGIAPLKRGGNRRYYRPADVAAIQTVARLLHDEGYTIKGAQKLLAGGTEPGLAAPSAVVAVATPDSAEPAMPAAAQPALSAAAERTTRAASTALPLAVLAAIRTDLAADLAAARAL